MYPSVKRTSEFVQEKFDRYGRWALLSGTAAVFLSACTPTVQVEAPREPITINLNVRLDADVRLRLIEDAQEDVDENPIF